MKISIEKQKLTVSQIGKRMGLARQGVQRIVNDLEQLGFVSLHHNPDHKVAKLVGLTDLGTSAMTQIDQIQTSWASKIADGLTESSLNETVAMIRNIRLRCEATEDQQKREKRD